MVAVEEMRRELGRATPLLAVVDGGLELLTGYLESPVDNRSDYRTSLTRGSNLGFRAKTPHKSRLWIPDTFSGARYIFWTKKHSVNFSMGLQWGSVKSRV